ncbi:hypothetical protein ARMSODRAFT_959664 [Armillaria solidipes]|uniref:Uncharacterized protein n=1 Tax=Armillaria solidipes TaxID=1076256 RepID=A0A2H3B7Z5_9AGAR|nr:hypothetical protein ARMSODRAFT_959664 [Armillaria solidipes]
MLTRLQSRALWLTCAVYRTTSIVALTHTTHIHLLDLERDRFAVRICKSSETSPIIQRLADDDWREGATSRAYSPFQPSQAPTKQKESHRGARFKTYWLSVGRTKRTTIACSPTQAYVTFTAISSEVHSAFGRG